MTDKAIRILYTSVAASLCLYARTNTKVRPESEEVTQSDETQLDISWDSSAAPHCMRELSILPAGSGSGHEHTAAPFDLGNRRPGLWVGCLHCLAGWLATTEEEKLKLHSLVGSCQ
jgi:hypothetical protein